MAGKSNPSMAQNLSSFPQQKQEQHGNNHLKAVVVDLNMIFQLVFNVESCRK
jgi:hypothetical protein